VSRPSGRERFEEAARALGLLPEVHHFPEGTKTAEDAARAVGCEVGQIVKSLVFMADGRAVLALTSGRNRVDLARLGVLCGAGEVRRATPEEARTATGFAVGGTPAFGHPAPLTTFIDADLLPYRQVWTAGGTPDTVFPIAPNDLLRVSGATVAAFAETAPAG
jgi:prolyl-tRNA editing enzyme YbaK/EbsC (Cys-tRNA(Pro) deacylase)